MGWFKERRARKQREASERKEQQRQEVLKSPCGQAKIKAGMDPFGHCPYPIGYSWCGPCELGKYCGFTKRTINPDWEPAEEIR